MAAKLFVHFLPELVTPEELAGGVVVVIDVLRASTTIACALAAGAVEVIPCLEVEDARRVAAGLPPGTFVLGGERGGRPIEGFDLGNSPGEYTPESVGGRTVVFTTTNGTKALMRCRLAKRVLVGSLVNRSAVCEALAEVERVHLVCAGTRGRITRDDVLAAGAIVEGLVETGGGRWELNDEARVAGDCFQFSVFSFQSRALGPVLAQALRATQGGRDLVEIGLGRDIDVAARVDSCPVVPELDLESFRLRLR
ncbi:MAG: 2-phosphosulfolactate phosphatase [Pirellulales bacterium]